MRRVALFLQIQGNPAPSFAHAFRLELGRLRPHDRGCPYQSTTAAPMRLYRWTRRPAPSGMAQVPSLREVGTLAARAPLRSHCNAVIASSMTAIRPSLAKDPLNYRASSLHCSEAPAPFLSGLAAMRTVSGIYRLSGPWVERSANPYACPPAVRLGLTSRGRGGHSDSRSLWRGRGAPECQ